jgi:hypothetical protein
MQFIYSKVPFSDGDLGKLLGHSHFEFSFKFDRLNDSKVD